MRYFGVEHYIGRTPLIRLRRLSELTGSEILGKAEFMNPGGSVKDRAALGIISDAEAKGVLKPGDTIVEGTYAAGGAHVRLAGNLLDVQCLTRPLVHGQRVGASIGHR